MRSTRDFRRSPRIAAGQAPEPFETEAASGNRRRRVHFALASLCAVGVALTAALPSVALAQTPNLRDLLKSFLRQGIVLAPPLEGVDHSAHFIGEDSGQFIVLDALNEEIGRQIASVPLSSSAGGFAYAVDPELGIPVRPTESFGPIFAERPLTVGQGKFNLGVNRSKFSFDQIDGVSLRDGDLRLLFVHQDVAAPGLDVLAEGDVITADLFLKVETEITAFVGNFGVTDDLDIGIVVPVVENRLTYTADAHIERLSTENAPLTHRFPDGSTEKSFGSSGHATGVGDIVLRGKYQIPTPSVASFAFAADARLPTGDQADLLGAGFYQVKGLIIGSLNHPRFSPHVNLGYGFSDDETNSSEVVYVAGFDWSVDPKLTVALDILGRYYPDVTTATVATAEHSYLDPDDDSVIRRISLPVLEQVEGDTRNRLDVTAGFKVNVHGNLLLNAAGLVPLSDDGLSDDFSALVGLDYSF